MQYETKFLRKRLILFNKISVMNWLERIIIETNIYLFLYRVSHKNVYIFLMFFSKTHRHQILRKAIALIEYVIKIKFWCFLTWLNDSENNYRLTASGKSHYRLVYIFFQNPISNKMTFDKVIAICELNLTIHLDLSKWFTGKKIKDINQA